MSPAAHTPASERARRVLRSARVRTANRRAGWGRERSTAIRKTGRWREPRDAFDPKIGTASACALRCDGGVEAAMWNGHVCVCV